LKTKFRQSLVHARKKFRKLLMRHRQLEPAHQSSHLEPAENNVAHDAEHDADDDKAESKKLRIEIDGADHRRNGV
jgi:hypothetical protein